MSETNELVANPMDKLKCLLYNDRTAKWYNLIAFKAEIKQDYMLLTIDGYENNSTTPLNNDMLSVLNDYILSQQQTEKLNELKKLNAEIKEIYNDIKNLKTQREYDKMREDLKKFKEYYKDISDFIEKLENGNYDYQLTEGSK